MSDTGYNIRQGSAILAERAAEVQPVWLYGPGGRLIICQCGETVPPAGHCQNVGTCTAADKAATRQSLSRGTAASARPAAWQGSGRVD